MINTIFFFKASSEPGFSSVVPPSALQAQGPKFEPQYQKKEQDQISPGSQIPHDSVLSGT